MILTFFSARVAVGSRLLLAYGSHTEGGGAARATRRTKATIIVNLPRKHDVTQKYSHSSQTRPNATSRVLPVREQKGQKSAQKSVSRWRVGARARDCAGCALPRAVSRACWLAA